MSISYQTHTKFGQTFIKVRLGRKLVGEIRAEAGGYRYWPRGSKTGGDLLPTVAAVKLSLETE